MKKHAIKSMGSITWTVEADKYELKDGFFNFFTFDNDQLFTVKAENVLTIKVEDVDK